MSINIGTLDSPLSLINFRTPVGLGWSLTHFYPFPTPTTSGTPRRVSKGTSTFAPSTRLSSFLWKGPSRRHVSRHFGPLPVVSREPETEMSFETFFDKTRFVQVERTKIISSFSEVSREQPRNDYRSEGRGVPALRGRKTPFQLFVDLKSRGPFHLNGISNPISFCKKIPTWSLRHTIFHECINESTRSWVLNTTYIYINREDT